MVEFAVLAQVGERAPLRQRRTAPLEAQLLARHQAMEAGEERVAAGDTAVDEERRQVVLVGLRRLARRLDQGSQVGAEQQSPAPLMVIGEAGADEVAVEQQSPGLAVEQGNREAAFEPFEGKLPLCEVEFVQLIGEQIQIARVTRRGVNNRTAE
ncbi:MAG: hypothetical protein HYS12_05760 [Planctomycetes bacterium]|nr:hypothetical protein [Planctomycetota bacterium]